MGRKEGLSSELQPDITPSDRAKKIAEKAEQEKREKLLRAAAFDFITAGIAALNGDEKTAGQLSKDAAFLLGQANVPDGYPFSEEDRMRHRAVAEKMLNILLPEDEDNSVSGVIEVEPLQLEAAVDETASQEDEEALPFDSTIFDASNQGKETEEVPGEGEEPQWAVPIAEGNSEVELDEEPLEDEVGADDPDTSHSQGDRHEYKVDIKDVEERVRSHGVFADMLDQKGLWITNVEGESVIPTKYLKTFLGVKNPARNGNLSRHAPITNKAYNKVMEYWGDKNITVSHPEDGRVPCLRRDDALHFMAESLAQRHHRIGEGRNILVVESEIDLVRERLEDLGATIDTKPYDVKKN